jgi:hypothetical protein
MCYLFFRSIQNRPMPTANTWGLWNYFLEQGRVGICLSVCLIPALHPHPITPGIFHRYRRNATLPEAPLLALRAAPLSNPFVIYDHQLQMFI